MYEIGQRKGGCVQVQRGACRRCDDDIWRICKKRSLDGVGDLLCEIDGSDILCAERGECLDGFEDLLGKLTSRYEDEGGCGRSGRSLGQD